MHKMCFYVNLSCEESNRLITLDLTSQGLALWPFLIECLAFFSKTVLDTFIASSFLGKIPVSSMS